MATRNGVPLPLDDRTVPTPAELARPFHAIPHAKKRAFLAAYAHCGQIGHAATLAGCDRGSHYDWKRTDPAYAAAFQVAQAMAVEAYEDEATRRALGWDETRYTTDGTPYTVRQQSDTLLIFRLKALKPEVYRDNYPRDDKQDISELLKAVLLELHRHQDASPALPVAYQTTVAPHSALPAPPSPAEDGEDRRAREARRPW